MTGATSRSRWRVVLLVSLGLLALSAYLALLARRRGTLLENGLREWAIGEVTDATDSVYRLAVGGMRLSLIPGQIRIDSIRLTTDTVRNDYRAHPYPVLHATATGCRVTGVDSWRLLTANGVSARLLHCDEIKAAVLEVVRPDTAKVAVADDPRSGIPFVRDSLKLPLLLPIVLVDRTELPRVSLDYTRRTRGGGQTHVTLERLSIGLRNTRLDPAVDPRRRRPLFSEQAIVTADTLLVQGEARQAFSFKRIQLNLTDSTLALDSVSVGPAQPDAEWVKAQKTRRDLVRFHLDSARSSGVDYRRLGSIEGALVARRTELHGMRIDVFTDKRLPQGKPRRRRTPQEWVASLDRPLAVDTVLVREGRITYRERAADRTVPGTITWEKVEAQVTDIRTLPPAGDTLRPMTVAASALLFGTGKLETTIRIPLTAPRFDMTYEGTLGPMDLTAVNALMERIMNAKVTQGSLQSLRFKVVVRNGFSSGQVVPLYRDFKVQLQDKDGGFLKKAGLSIVTLFANAFKVRGNNPGDPGKKPVAGIIRLAYRPTASLPQVFWFALKEGLGKVFLK